MKTYMEPCVLKETSEGLARYTLADALFQNREIMIVGEITPDLVNSAILQMRYLQNEDKQKEITVFINSPGGDVASGLALYDVMQAVECPIRTVCVGSAFSMGAILFVSGDKREMLAHSRVMIHDPLIQDGYSGSALKIETLSKNLMKRREITASIIAKHSGKTLEEILEKTAKDTYFEAEEAVAYGLADKIIYEI